jgi:hypothetical protein
MNLSMARFAQGNQIAFRVKATKTNWNDVMANLSRLSARETNLMRSERMAFTFDQIERLAAVIPLIFRPSRKVVIGNTPKNLKCLLLGKPRNTTLASPVSALDPEILDDLLM